MVSGSAQAWATGVGDRRERQAWATGVGDRLGDRLGRQVWVTGSATDVGDKLGRQAWATGSATGSATGVGDRLGRQAVLPLRQSQFQTGGGTLKPLATGLHDRCLEQGGAAWPTRLSQGLPLLPLEAPKPQGVVLRAGA